MRVRVIRKLADRVDGIDLSHCGVGRLIELSDAQGRIIVAERWAEYARRRSDVDGSQCDRRRTVDGYQWDRRSTASDLYQRFENKRDEIDRDRRCLRRRATDVTHSPLPISASVAV